MSATLEEIEHGRTKNKWGPGSSKNTPCPNCGSRDIKWIKEKSIWNQCNICGNIFAADHQEADNTNEGGRLI